MDGSPGSGSRRLQVERRFEGSRLEKQLRAMAYECAIPLGTRSLEQQPDGEQRQPRCGRVCVIGKGA